MIKAVDKSDTIKIFMAKRLGLFESDIKVKRPTNALEAMKGLSGVIEAVADGTLDQDKARQLQSLYTAYISAYEVTELEERIAALEVHNEK